MKKIISLLLIACSLSVYSQATCAGAVTLNSGACLTNQTFPGSVNMAGLCVGGSNPALYIRFVAGTCSEFTITSSANISTIGSQILTSACAGVAGTLECHDNVIANYPFSVNGINTTGGNLLTAGTTYVLRLWGPVPAGTTFSICYKANQTINASDECAGALTLGALPTNFYNGGDCQFTGTYTNAGASDPPANVLCAGSLENTQWIKFTPQAGVLDFTIIGSNIQCTGGGCGFQFGIVSGPCFGSTFEGCYGNKVCSGGQSVAGPINQNANDGYSLAWSNLSANSFQVTITRTGGLAFTGAEVFYLIMDGNADADCSYTLQGSNLIPLALELTSFQSYNEESNIILYWSTYADYENQYFKIERSVDAFTWEPIGMVSKFESFNELKKYTFTDSNLQPGIYYYRLRHIDVNGNKHYSDVIKHNLMHQEKCISYEYFNLIGHPIDIETAPTGIYIRKCGRKFTKIFKE